MNKVTISNQPFSEAKEPTTAEVRGWLEMPTGKYFVDLLKNQIVEIQENFINGDYTGSSTDETIQLNAAAIGSGQAIANILLTLEEMSTDEQNTDNYQE